MLPFSSSTAEINLNALLHNHKTIKDGVSPQTQIAAVVKANAYGHGAVEVAKVLKKEGVNFFCVARVEEAIQLRDAGLDAEILVFSPPIDSNRNAYLTYNLIATFSDFAQFSRAKNGMRVHINIDTGMGRLGIMYNEVGKLEEALKQYEGMLSVEGIYTHFSDAESPSRELTALQIDRFDKVLTHFKTKKWLVHQANSAAIAGISASHRQLVRPGIALYGYDEGFSFAQALLPVMTWKSQLVEVRKVPANWPISYGATYFSKEEGYVGVLPVGYADGLNRLLSGQVQFANAKTGKLYSQVGRITMDHCMIWLGEDQLEVGTNMDVLNGKAESTKLWAKKVNSIPYEIVCAMSARVERSYIWP